VLGLHARQATPDDPRQQAFEQWQTLGSSQVGRQINGWIVR